MGKRVFSDDEVNKFQVEPDQPKKRVFSDAEVNTLTVKPPDESDDSKFFTNQYGVRQKRTLSDYERTAGSSLGAIEAPLFGGNDEAMGTFDALTQQGADLFGLLPKGKKPQTINEAIADAQRIKNRYAAARESGEIDFWDNDNVAANAAGTFLSIAPYNYLYKGAKTAADIGQAILTKGSNAVSGFEKLLNTGYGLAGSGAIASELYEALTPDGSLKERVDHLVDAGAAPLAAGALFGVAGGAAGAGGAKGLQFVAKQALPPAKAAARRLAEILNDAELKTKDIADSHAANQAVKPDATFAEAGPEWFRGWQTEGGVAARSQGSKDLAAKTLLERQRGSTRRIEEDIVEAFGGGGAFKTTYEGIKKAAQEAAEPLYKEAYAQPPIQSAKLYRLINSVTGRKMMQAALDVMEASPNAKTPMVVTNVAGRVVGWPTEAIQYMKKGLENMISREFKVEGRPEIAKAYKEFKEMLLDEVDQLNPIYGKARAKYAGEMETRDALESGFKLAFSPKEEIAAAMEKLNPSELDFFKRGFAQHWINTVRKSTHGGNIGGRLLNSNIKEDGARLVLGDDAFNALKHKAELEARMTDNFNEVYGNSKTAERLQAREDSNAQSAEEMFSEIAAPLVEPVQWIKNAGMSWIAQKLRFFDKAKRAEITRMLFSRNKDEQAEAIKQIEAQMARAQHMKENMGAAQGFGGGVTSTTGQATINDIKDNQGF